MHWLLYQISCCVVWWSGKWTAIGDFFREYAINDDLSPVFLRYMYKELLAIRRIFSLVDMITNTKFSNCPNVFEIGAVWQ